MRRHTRQLGGHAQTHGAARSHGTGFCGVCTHCLSAHTVCLPVCLHTLSVCLSVCLHTLSVCLSAHTGTAEKARGERKACVAVTQPYGDHAPSRFTRPPALPTTDCEAFVVVVLRGNPSSHCRGQSVSGGVTRKPQQPLSRAVSYWWCYEETPTAIVEGSQLVPT